MPVIVVCRQIFKAQDADWFGSWSCVQYCCRWKWLH